MTASRSSATAPHCGRRISTSTDSPTGRWSRSSREPAPPLAHPANRTATHRSPRAVRSALQRDRAADPSPPRPARTGTSPVPWQNPASQDLEPVPGRDRRLRISALVALVWLALLLAAGAASCSRPNRPHRRTQARHRISIAIIYTLDLLLPVVDRQARNKHANPRVCPSALSMR